MLFLQKTILLLFLLKRIKSSPNHSENVLFQPNHIQLNSLHFTPTLKRSARPLSDFVVFSIGDKKPQLILPEISDVVMNRRIIMEDENNGKDADVSRISKINFDLQVCQATAYKMVRNQFENFN